MLSKPTASILIVAYNAGAFIAKAMESLRDQSLANWELIVVEDGSNDETKTLVDKFANTVSQPVKYLNNGRNLGVSQSRSRALESSEGDFIAFLDADDWWSSDHLENASKLFDANSHGLVYSAINVVDSTTESISFVAKPTQIQIDNPRDQLFETSFIQTSSCVALSRSAIEKVGSFDSALSIGEDRDYWIRCAEADFTFGYTDKASCNYLKHPQNTMSKTLKVSAQAIEFYKRRDEHLYSSAALKKKLADAYYTYAVLARKSDPESAKRAIKLAIKHRPLSAKFMARYIQIAQTR